MKLICFHLFNDYSGSPKVLKNILSTLLEKDIRVELITSKGGILDELEGHKNIKFRRYSYKYSNNPLLTMLRYIFVQIYTFFVALGYLTDKEAIFYINTILPAGPALAGWLTGKKVVYHYHENATVKSSFYRALAWFMQKVASNIVCVSNYQRSFLKREKNVCVIPNALEESFVARLNPSPEEAFARKRVLMIGSLKRYKGTLEFTQLATMLPDFNFELVLNDTKENIDSFLQENNIKNTSNLTLHPRQEDVAPFYNRASLVLNLSNKNLFIETFGLTALEAMSAGVPVIVPSVGGIAEIVDDGVNGYKIDVNNVQEIAKNIKKILSNRDLYLSLSRNALKISKKYSSATMAERFLSIINSK